MKYIITAFTITLSFASFSQLSDSLVKNKEQMLGRFFDLNYGHLSSVNNYMEPDVFILKLDSFKNYAYAQANAGQNDLRKKDIDAFSRLTINEYIRSYGIDTIKEKEFYQLLTDEKPDSAFQRRIQDAEKQRFVKKLPKRIYDSLVAAINDGWNINDSALFKTSNAFRRLVELKINNVREEKYSQGLTSREGYELAKQRAMNELVSDQFIANHYNYEIMDYILKTGEDAVVIDSAYKEYMKTAKNTLYGRKIDTVYRNYKTYSKGAPAPDFNYTDVNGRKVSLRSMRGKYVYIDVWATWCGPCKREIPYLTKLEEEYKSKNIHFVSLSVDKLSDKAVWEKYVKSNNLKGIQLIADENIGSGFIRKFNINFIPRFILIDPDGRIVDANAMRPSDEKIREQFNSLL